CVAHVSRQGQGPRKSRKKQKMDQVTSFNAAHPSVASLTAPGLLTSAAQANLLQNAALQGNFGMGALGALRASSVGSNSVASSHHSAAQQALALANLQNNIANSMAAAGEAKNRNFSQNVIINPNRVVSGGAKNTESLHSDDIANQISSEKKDDGSASEGGASHAVEDEVVCTSMNGMEYNHFGTHHLIRMWTSFALSRRSFSLLARASFIASKCGMNMDDILANKSPFAALTNTPPMTWLSVSILCPREQQSTLGPRVKPQELPWDLLKAFNIDLNKLVVSPDSFGRWVILRWNTQGKTRFWASPLFERDFATIDEMERVWVENKKEVIDLFLPKSEKKKFGASLSKLTFLNKEPNAPCYATRTPMKVRPRNSQQTIDVMFVNAFKIIDLDQSIHYHEIRLDIPQDKNTSGGVQARNTSVTSTMLADMLSSDGGNKKRNLEQVVNSEDPLLNKELDITDLDMTDELEEWMTMLDDPFK
ncbi:MAG: hypothetical protein SGARI_003093, partial [Bacillariaceae sp.]